MFISGCSVNHQWNNKPLHLLINRKNKKHSDLTINNLQFICPNCFLCKIMVYQYGKNRLKQKYFRAESVVMI